LMAWKFFGIFCVLNSATCDVSRDNWARRERYGNESNSGLDLAKGQTR